MGRANRRKQQSFKPASTTRWCRLCKLPVPDVQAHDADAQHRRRVATLYLDRAIQKVTGWSCPGTLVPLRW